MVFDYLLKHKIGIGQPMDPDEFLTEEDKDYLQEYLDEVAALPTYSEDVYKRQDLLSPARRRGDRTLLFHWLRRSVDESCFSAG